MHVHVCVCKFVCMYVSAFVCVCVYVCKCIRVCMCVCVCVCGDSDRQMWSTHYILHEFKSLRSTPLI